MSNKDINPSETVAEEPKETPKEPSEGLENEPVKEEEEETVVQQAEVKDPEPEDPQAGLSDEDFVKLVNDVTGRNYKTRDGALKGIKETYNYVGKKVEASETPVDKSQFVSKDEFDKAMFYKDNPQYKDYEGLISSLKKANSDKSLSEIIATDDFKKLFEKASSYDEAQKSKSVLHSNPKLGQATDKISKADSALQAGRDDEARGSAVGAVLDAFEK